MEGDLYYTGGVWLHETISEGWDKWGGGWREQGDERRKKRKDESDSREICSVSEQTCWWSALARHPSPPLSLSPAWCLSAPVALFEQLNHTHPCTHTYTQTLYNQLVGWANEVWEQLKNGDRLTARTVQCPLCSNPFLIFKWPLFFSQGASARVF